MKNNRKHQNIKTLTQTKIWERYQNTNPEKKTILSLRSKPQKRILEDQNYEKKRWRTYRDVEIAKIAGAFFSHVVAFHRRSSSSRSTAVPPSITLVVSATQSLTLLFLWNVLLWEGWRWCWEMMKILKCISYQNRGNINSHINSNEGITFTVVTN